MPDYRPIPLGKLCNCGIEVYGERVPPLGKQAFQGLPFVIGSPHGRNVFVGVGPRVKPKARKRTSKPKASAASASEHPDQIVIPIRRTAHNLVIAHALLEADALSGEAVGRTVAEYVIQLAGGQEHRVRIRERFEVGWMPLGWGHYPFCSLPDQKDVQFSRDTGRWEDAGRRQTETDQGWPQGYYLWAWTNPDPKRRIESLTLIGRGATFIIAGITTGHVDEFPFNRDAATPVRITVAQKPAAKKRSAKQQPAPQPIEVDVDRGYATYVYPLPEKDADAFLTDGFKGWGEAQNKLWSNAYCEVMGTPSATVTVRQGGRPVGRFNWGTLRRKGRAAAGAARVELLEGGKNWVHTTVLDDETGKPVPCRIHFRTPAGVPYQPHGHHPHVNSNIGTWHHDVGGDVRLGQITYAYIDGKCQGWLPRGEVIVDVARGYEYEPIRERLTIAPGQRELTLRLKRWTDMNRERYFSGDTHVHFLSTQGSHLESQAEGLNVVNLLLSQWGGLFTSTEEFIGAPSVSPDGRNIVYATQENRQHMLGHLTLLGLREPVMPWCTGGPSEGELGGGLDTTMSAWADACHAQGGTVVIPHVPVPNCEPAVLIATGRADAVEMLAHSEYFHKEYYRFLNCGYRLPLVGGTDKMSAEVPVGMYRTYCHIPADEPFTYETWCRALRSGNTFHSGGPMIRLSVEGRPIGSTIELPGSGGTLEIEAGAESILPIHTLQIVQQGRVVASTDEAKGARRLRLRASLRVDGHCWLAARCAGPGYQALPHHDEWKRGVMAHTSPIYVAVGGEYAPFSMEDAQYMLTLVEGGLTYIRTLAPRRDPELTTYQHSHTDHQAFLEEPFHQAREAIHRRMHQLGIPH